MPGRTATSARAGLLGVLVPGAGVWRQWRAVTPGPPGQQEFRSWWAVTAQVAALAVLPGGALPRGVGSGGGAIGT